MNYDLTVKFVINVNTVKLLHPLNEKMQDDLSATTESSYRFLIFFIFIYRALSDMAMSLYNNVRP